MAPTFWAAATEIAGQGVIYSRGGGHNNFFGSLFSICVWRMLSTCAQYGPRCPTNSPNLGTPLWTPLVFSQDCSYWMVVSECCIIHQFGHPCFKIGLFFRVLSKVRRKTTDQGWDDAGCTTGSIPDLSLTQIEVSPFPMRLGRTGTGGIGLISLLTLNSITIAGAWING